MQATLTEAFLRRVEAFYSPTQPRDKEGQWTRTPGGKVWSGVSAHPDHRQKPTPDMSAVAEMRDDAEAFAHRLFTGDLGNGARATVTDAYSDDFGGAVSMSVEGYLSVNGEHAGTFKRSVTFQDGELSVYHDELLVEPQFQGVGIADRFNSHAVAEYQRIGVDHISLEAGLTVGGYAWARQGFRYNEDTGDVSRQEFLHKALDGVEVRYHAPVIRPHVAQLRREVAALRKAIDAGEDIQPIHIASLGERYARYTGLTDEGYEYPTWPGKSALIGRTWDGIYYFDAANPVTASATSLEHAELRPAFREMVEAFACRQASCRPPTSGGSGGSLRRQPLPDVAPGDVRFAYRPRHPDGHADPGEIVWAHVPFEDNPKQGKDRPVLIVGRTESGNLVGVQLTTKGHHRGSFPIEWGTDKKSYLRTDRFVQVDATNYRKEGAYVRKPKFQEIVNTISTQHGLTMQVFVSHVESFACHDASCRPPTSGGTGGSSPTPHSGFSGMSARPYDRTVPVSKLKGMEKDEVVSEVRSWYEGDLPHGHSSVVTSIKPLMSNGEVAIVRVTGKIKNQFGRNVGDFERSVTIDAGKGATVVFHESLVIESGSQNKGVAEAFNGRSVDQYQRMGVDSVETNAGYSVGGYAWAVAGFRTRTSDALNYIVDHATTKLHQLAQAAQITSYQEKTLLNELNALHHAANEEQDVQPVHIASLGRDIQFEREGTSGKYTTWPGKEMMLGSEWPGVFYFDAAAVTASVEEFYSPTQPRDKEGQWTAHRSNLTSLSRDSLDRAIDKGVKGIFGEIGLTGTTPWPSAPRSKKGPRYDKALVDEALRKPPVLEKVDPRILYATQNGLVRTHINYYLGDEYKRTGRTAADQTNSANAFPVVYVTRDGKHIILTGHHRSAAALIKGEDLDAIVVREP